MLSLALLVNSFRRYVGTLLRSAYFWLIVLTLIAYLIRVVGARSSITYIPDTQIIREAMEVGQTFASRHAFDIGLGTNPFKYPLTLPYLLLAVYGVMFVVGMITRTISSLTDFTNLLFIQREMMHYFAVLALAAINSAVVPAIYFAARGLNKKHLGWLAAGAATFDLLMVHFSQHARPHAPLASFFLIAIILLVRVVEGGSWRWAIAATVVCALAVGTLQNGIVILIPWGIAWTIRIYDSTRAKTFRREIILATINACMLLALCIAVYPSLVSEYGQLAINILTGSQNYSLGGGSHSFARSMFSLSNVSQFLNRLFSYEPFWILLTPFALLYFIYQRRLDIRLLAVVLPLPLINVLMWSIYWDNLPRYYLSFVPFMILVCAYLLEDVAIWIADRFNRSQFQIITALSIIVLVPLMILATRLVIVSAQTDTRTLASQWVKQNLPADTPLMANFQLLELVPTQEGLRRQQKDFPGTLGTYNQWLLQQSSKMYPTPAFDIVDYSLYWTNDKPTQKKIINEQNIQYILVQSYTSRVTLEQPVPEYAQRYGTPLQIFCPGKPVQRAYLPIDISDGWAWQDIWATERPGPIVIIYKLQDSPMPDNTLPMIACQ